MSGNLLRKKQFMCILHFMQSIALNDGAGVAINDGGDISTDAPVVIENHLSNCSRTDKSNGTLCVCGTTLEQHCGSVRRLSAGGDACSRCVQTVSSESECTHQMEQRFCNSCTPAFDFRWLDDVPTPLKNVTPINGYAMHRVCEGSSKNISELEKIEIENLLGLENFDLEIFQVVGCASSVLEGFAMQMGTPVYNGATNDTDFFVHGDTFDYVIECCENWHTNVCSNYDDPALETFYKLLKKFTDGCQPDLLRKELETFGVLDADVGSSLFREFYMIDLRKMSFVIQPLVPVLFGAFYGSQLRFILGLTLGAVAKHGCGNSWFMPGADRLYADTFKVQGDFYFPSTIPSPLASLGSCGTSSTSELVRLGVCEKVGTYMYDNARISGMSIIGCAVDCIGSRLENVVGAFVSVSLVIVEIDTNSVGVGKQHGGLNASIDLLNREGMNITNDVKTTVGFGFHFTVDRIGTEDLLTTINWKEATQHATNFTTAAYFPNVTEAMLAYKIPKHTNSKKTDLMLSTWEIALIASVVTVALGVVIGVAVRRVKNSDQNNQTNTHVPQTDNVDYEDTLPAISSEA